MWQKCSTFIIMNISSYKLDIFMQTEGVNNRWHWFSKIMRKQSSFQRNQNHQLGFSSCFLNRLLTKPTVHPQKYHRPWTTVKYVGEASECRTATRLLVTTLYSLPSVPLIDLSSTAELVKSKSGRQFSERVLQQE